MCSQETTRAKELELEERRLMNGEKKIEQEKEEQEHRRRMELERMKSDNEMRMMMMSMMKHITKSNNP